MSVDVAAFNSILQRLETVADRLEKGSSGSGGSASAGAAADDDAEIALALDAFMKDKAAPIEAAAAALASADVTEATQFFMDALRYLRSIFSATAKCRKPKDDEWMKFLGPYSELSQKAGKACDNRSDFFSNRKAAAEANGIVMLVTVPGPSGHVQQVLESMDFHAIKVMQKKVPNETAWINALKTCLKDLVEFCKENCKMGLNWKVGGEDPVAYFAAAPLGSAPSAAKPAGKGKGKGPAIPKGGNAPPPPQDAPKPASGGGGGGMANVFADLAKFKDGTGGLKKVSDDMKCKNMKDAPPREALKPKPAAPKPAAGGGRFAKGPKGEPSKELVEEQNTWIVKNYDGNHSIDVPEAKQHHVIRIQDCSNSTITLSGTRVKAISIDSCIKTSVIMKDVISVVEVVNSDRMHLQTVGEVKMFSVDKCDGIGIRLSKESLEAEIVSSKSSEMNVTIPDPAPGKDEYDTIEIPIPEQFVTKVVGTKCKTGVSDIYSS